MRIHVLSFPLAALAPAALTAAVLVLAASTSQVKKA